MSPYKPYGEMALTLSNLEPVMTVELRTNPPIVYLYVRGSPAADLTGDFFGEMAGAAAANAKSAAKAPTFDPANSSNTGLYQKYLDDMEKFNVKTLSAVSVFIDGLNELGLAMDIAAFKSKMATNQDVSAFFKGTRFGGKDTGHLNSVVANMLKSALPGDLAVKIGVKTRWEVEDVVRYGIAIREALAKSGVAQPNTGYSGAKSGLLRGFGVYKLAG